MTLERGTPLQALLLKLEAWMLQQPEWLALIALPRNQRRAAMRELANRLYTIPMRDTSLISVRPLKRAVKKAVAKQGAGELASVIAAMEAEVAKDEVKLDEPAETVAVEPGALERHAEAEAKADADGVPYSAVPMHRQAPVDILTAEGASIFKGPVPNLGAVDRPATEEVGFIETDEVATQET